MMLNEGAAPSSLVLARVMLVVKMFLFVEYSVAGIYYRRIGVL